MTPVTLRQHTSAPGSRDRCGLVDVADRFPLEELTVPTLVINARDDPLAPYRFAVKAASQIPGARLVTIEAGGHFSMGHDTEVREAIGAFVGELT